MSEGALQFGVEQVIAGGRTVVLPTLTCEPQDCAYLPGRAAVLQVALVRSPTATVYQQLMDRNYRRSGRLFYRPQCGSCRACIGMRVPVERFAPSRSQRRVLRRCADVQVAIGPPVCDQERFDIYSAYQEQVHDQQMQMDYDRFAEFFFESPISTLEFTYRLDGRLVAAGVVDATPTALSSVYFYYDPRQARRSLGVFSALVEIEECRRRGLAHWYTGYWVPGCSKMAYKSAFRPFELLSSTGEWRAAEEASGEPA